MSEMFGTSMVRFPYFVQVHNRHGDRYNHGEEMSHAGSVY